MVKCCAANPVNPEQSPIIAPSVKSDEIPDSFPQDMAVGLDVAFSGTTILIGVGEGHMMPTHDSSRQQVQHGPVDSLSGRCENLCGHSGRYGLPPQTRGE